MTGLTEDVAALGTELTRIEKLLGSLEEAEWAAPTRLEAPDPGQPKWTVLQLAGHLGMAIAMVSDLVNGRTTAEPETDGVAFFRLPKAEVDPVIFRFAWDMTKNRTPAEVLESCQTSFCQALQDVGRADGGLVGPTVGGLMRLDEFVRTRIVEAVVHGIDLATAVDREFEPSDRATATAARVFDEVLRATDGRDRPAGLSDDLEWIQVASGRRPSDELLASVIGR